MKALVTTAMNEGAMGGRQFADLRTRGTYAENARTDRDHRHCGAGCGGPCIFPTCARKATGCSRAIDELVEISRKSGARGRKSTDLKMAGRGNWAKYDQGDRADRGGARGWGLSITADMYLYAAGATGLDAADADLGCRPGGLEAWIERLKDPATRARVAAEMAGAGQGMGEFLRGCRPRRHVAGRLQERSPQAAHRQDPDRGRQNARKERLPKRRWIWSSRMAAASAPSIS